ncbi:hypothetical protein GQF11_05085 [Neisseria meningitidis]|nr:hypothetical protein [Neisseria meningitidis]MVZ48625.1 hypothetical protein [Neisseria meningitidis]MVZ57746.1 hypothetical protein [Neisseria meningitidis]MVZ70644.1 hypothetical protein [Neisseria meningitidis]
MPSSSNRPANRKPIWRSTTRRKIFQRQAGLAGKSGKYSGLTKTSTALPRLSSKRTIL